MGIVINFACGIVINFACGGGCYVINCSLRGVVIGVAALTIDNQLSNMAEPEIMEEPEMEGVDANAADSPTWVAAASRDRAPHNTGNRNRTPHQQQRRENMLSRRTCYCCLVIPFVLVFVLSAISVLTLAIENEIVHNKCPKIKCLINTCINNTVNSDPKVYWSDCGIALSGGALMCSVSILFIISLVIRMCFATKL